MSADSFYSRARVQPARTARIVTYLEAIVKAGSDEGVDSIVVLPPDTGDNGDAETDLEDVVDDGNDEEGCENGFEAAGEYELLYDGDGEEDDSSANAEPSAKRSRSGCTPTSAGGRWRKMSSFDEELPAADFASPLANHFPDLISKSPFELWTEIFPTGLADMVVEQTNLYASLDRNEIGFSTTRSEILQFFGVLLLSRYNKLPYEDHYWSNDEDLGVDVVSKAMSRHSFRAIKRNLHFADNQKLMEGDKVAKVSPLYSILNTTLTKFGVFHPDLSIDESMVPYFGKHSCKMFIRGKLIRFGYKIWCLCGPDGYPYGLKIYTGKEERSAGPLGSRVVNGMVDIVRNHSNVERHQLFFDNFFTSYDLLSNLGKDGVRATGTVRENQTGGVNKVLTDTKAMKKSARGTFDYRCDGDVYMCKWKDNACVMVASNCLTHEPIHKTQRWVQHERRNVDQPDLIHAYNSGMGGVDVMDRLLSSYRPKIRGKKSYWPLFANALNLSVVAAWRLHCNLEDKPLSHLAFRRYISVCMLKMHHVDRPQVGGGIVPDMPDDVRYDGIGHDKFPATQGRCKWCKKNCRYECIKCGVRLHYDKGAVCATLYHRRA